MIVAFIIVLFYYNYNNRIIYTINQNFKDFEVELIIKKVITINTSNFDINKNSNFNFNQIRKLTTHDHNDFIKKDIDTPNEVLFEISNIECEVIIKSKTNNLFFDMSKLNLKFKNNIYKSSPLNWKGTNLFKLQKLDSGNVLKFNNIKYGILIDSLSIGKYNFTLRELYLNYAD